MAEFAPNRSRIRQNSGGECCHARRVPRRLETRTLASAATPRSRNGLTLLELLLVLGVLLVLAAATWPSAARLYRSSRLRQAALVAHEGLSAARLQAMRQGVPYEFRYEPGGRRCVALPMLPANDERSADATSLPGALLAAAPADPLDVLWRSLPSDVRFADAAGQVSPGERISSDQLRRSPSAPLLADAEWSPAICFYPDGSATDAGLTVADTAGDALLLQVLRVTGGVKIRVP